MFEMLIAYVGFAFLALASPAFGIALSFISTCTGLLSGHIDQVAAMPETQSIAALAQFV